MCLGNKWLNINQRLIIIFMACTKKNYVFPFQNATSTVLLAVYVIIFCWRRRGGQLKVVVVKQMLFRPGIREGLVHGSVKFSCPRFFLLLNMDDVRHCGDFLSLKVFFDWFSCCSMTHVPLLAIIAIHHLLIHLFKRSKDNKERVHYGIIFITLLIA